MRKELETMNAKENKTPNDNKKIAVLDMLCKDLGATLIEYNDNDTGADDRMDYTTILRVNTEINIKTIGVG